MSGLILTADALVGTPGAGQTEFSGTIFTGAPTAATRGIIPTEQFFRLNANLVGANATGAQNILGVGVTLSASTIYEFEAVFMLIKSAGTTSHTAALGFGGTATLNNITYNIISAQPIIALTSGGANTTDNIIQTATASVVTSALTTAAQYLLFTVKGTVSINAGGTFIPQYTLSAAPGGAYSTVAGSYMKIKPIGVSGANTSVGTWA